MFEKQAERFVSEKSDKGNADLEAQKSINKSKN